MDTPLVSVVISSYNRPAMLVTALQSVINQSYPNLEIIIQDDSTSGECELAIRRFSDPRIKYTRNQPPLGTAANLRAGYRKSIGKYFSTLNDDDYYGPTYIETMVKHLEEKTSFAMAFCDHWIVGDEGKVDETLTDSNSSIFRRSALKEGSVPNPLATAILDKSVPGMFAVFRRSSMDLGDFPDEVSSGYDYWLDYLAVRNGAPIYYSPLRLTYYRVHSGSQTHSFTDPNEALRSHRYSEYMLTRFLHDSRLAPIHSGLRLRLAEVHAGMGMSWLRLGQRRQAASNLLLSCSARPRAKTFVGLLLCFAPLAVTRKLSAK